MLADAPPPTPYTDSCVVAAAERFDLPTTVLYAILRVEGGKVGEKSQNTNGSYDMGPMQINSLWIPTFNGFISEHEILNDGCKNVLVGAWILRLNINETGDFWQGVGNYHSRTDERNTRYQWKVYRASLTLG